jgi:hypothetical protein
MRGVGRRFCAIHSWELDIANEATAPVCEDELLGFVFAKFVYSDYDCVGHRDDIPTAPYNLFHGLEAHEFVASLHIAARAKADGPLRAWELTVTRLVLFMDLAILAKLETQMLFVIQRFSGHDCLRTDRVRYSSLNGEVIQELDAVEHDVYGQKLGDPVERKPVW